MPFPFLLVHPSKKKNCSSSQPIIIHHPLMKNWLKPPPKIIHKIHLGNLKIGALGWSCLFTEIIKIARTQIFRPLPPDPKISGFFRCFCWGSSMFFRISPCRDTPTNISTGIFKQTQPPWSPRLPLASGNANPLVQPSTFGVALEADLSLGNGIQYMSHPPAIKRVNGKWPGQILSVAESTSCFGAVFGALLLCFSNIPVPWYLLVWCLSVVSVNAASRSMYWIDFSPTIAVGGPSLCIRVQW